MCVSGHELTGAAWRALTTAPCLLFHHRAQISPLIRFATINPVTPQRPSPPDAGPNKCGDSQPKWLHAHTTHVLSAIFHLLSCLSAITPSACPSAIFISPCGIPRLPGLPLPVASLSFSELHFHTSNPIWSTDICEEVGATPSTVRITSHQAEAPFCHVSIKHLLQYRQIYFSNGYLYHTHQQHHNDGYESAMIQRWGLEMGGAKGKKIPNTIQHTHSYTQTWGRQMWAATRGLQLFIMKDIHCSVPALPLSTQFFHTGLPSLPLVPCLSICPSFLSLPHFFLNPVWGWGNQEREREREWAICRTAWRPAWGPCLSLLLPPIPSPGSGLCAQEHLLYLGICGAPLGGGEGVHHRTQHLFSSQAICSVSLVLPVGLWRRHPPRSMVTAESWWEMRCKFTPFALM